VFFIQNLFVSEPKGSSEELDPVLKGYYDVILGKAPVKKGRGGSKQIMKNRVTKKSSQESGKAENFENMSFGPKVVDRACSLVENKKRFWRQKLVH